MQTHFKVLIVEDIPSDAELNEKEISKVLDSCDFRRVETEKDFLEQINSFKPDIIISDYRMPTFDGMSALKIALEKVPLTPFIIVTGSLNEDTAVDCMKAGAADYVIKEHLGRLGPVVLTALEQKKIKTEKKKAEETLAKERMLLRTLIDNLPDAIYVKDCDTKKVLVNKADLKNIGKSLEEVINRTDWDVFPEDIARKFYADDISVIRDGTPVINREELLINNFGYKSWLLTSKLPLYDNEGKIIGLVGIGKDITERKELEKILSESEERYRSLFNNILNGFAFCQMLFVNNQPEDFIYLEVNNAFEKLTGLKNVIGKKVSEVIPGIQKSNRELFEIYGRVSLTGIPEKVETYVQPLGTWFSIAVYSPKKEHFVAVFDNITERKKGEEQIIKLNRVYAVLSNINQAIVRINDIDDLLKEVCRIAVDDGKFRMAWIGMLNPETNKVDVTASAGYTGDFLEEINIDLNDEEQSNVPTAKAVKSGNHSISKDIEHDQNILTWQKSALKNGYRSSASFPLKIFGKIAGAYNLFSNEIDFFDEKEIKLLDEMAMDISFALEVNQIEKKRRKAEENLKKLSSAVEQAADTIMITNREGTIEYVNPAFEELTGYSSNEVIGTTPRILKSGVKEQEYYEQLWKTILSGNVYRAEIVNKKKNGEFYYEEKVITPIMDKNKNITHFVGTGKDITERKITEKELIIAKELAEQSNKLKDAFIANISHEIRTPLNGILGLTSIIKDQYTQYISKEDESLFEGIDHSSQRIIRTVDMILNYSRLQAHEFPIKLQELEISSICENLIREFQTPANLKSIKLIFENQLGKTVIIADSYSLEQAISNLLDNSIKYTRKGFVKIILSKNSSDETLLVIKDTGIGISEEYLKNIFEPYRQEEMGYGRAYEGVGLGLALVKKFMDLNSARITVESIKGEGTTFTINFGNIFQGGSTFEQPVIGKTLLKKVPQTGETSETKKNHLILLVEDDRINQVTIGIFIKNNYEVIITDSSDKAIEILGKNNVNIILMDISIRGNMDGLQLTKEIKASPEYSCIPIIAVTAHASEQDRQNAINAGCDEYLAKPFTRKELLDVIAKYE